MKTNFNFNSQICTSRSQSKRLLALGLKPETADCYYFYCDIVKEWKSTILSSTQVFKDYPTTVIPAWSLHRLIEMIPFDIWHTEYEDSPHLKHTFYFSKYAPSYNSYEDIDFRAHPTLYDNILDCIEWLIKDGYFNKEYLV